MRTIIFHLVLCGAAALAPFQFEKGQITSKGNQFPDWPSQFEGHSIRQLQLTDREQRFQEGFPGRIGRFTDGNREIVIRQVACSTRKLHSAVDCFRALGYTIQPLPLRKGDSQRLWGCFEASRLQERFVVYECIEDSLGNGWTDVSAWYWAAVFAKTSTAPWTAWTVAEKQR